MKNHFEDIKEGSVIQGIFKPKSPLNISYEAEEYVGKTLTFTAEYIQPYGGGFMYSGQWIFQPHDEDGNWISMGWVPMEDIEILE